MTVTNNSDFSGYELKADYRIVSRGQLVEACADISYFNSLPSLDVVNDVCEAFLNATKHIYGEALDKRKKQAKDILNTYGGVEMKRFTSDKLHEFVSKKFFAIGTIERYATIDIERNQYIASEADIAMYLMKELNIGVYPRGEKEDGWQATDYSRWIGGNSPEQSVFKCAAKILEATK